MLGPIATVPLLLTNKKVEEPLVIWKEAAPTPTEAVTLPVAILLKSPDTADAGTKEAVSAFLAQEDVATKDADTALNEYEDVTEFTAQEEVPNKEPLNEPDVDPIDIISSPFEPDFLMNAKPSYVFSAISPNSREDVVGTLPGTELLRSFKNWLDMCPVRV